MLCECSVLEVCECANDGQLGNEPCEGTKRARRQPGVRSASGTDLTDWFSLSHHTSPSFCLHARKEERDGGEECGVTFHLSELQVSELLLELRGFATR